MTAPPPSGDSHPIDPDHDAVLPWHDARRAMCELFSPLAHDLRAGLNGITVWTHVLERTGSADPAQSVEGIRRAVAQQSNLAQELSDCGRALQVQPGELPERVELEGLVHEAIAEVVPQAAARGVEIVYRPSPDPLVVSGHERMLRNLVHLLLRDAAHVALDGSPITVSASRDGARASITVAGAETGAAGARKSLRRAMAAILALFQGGSVRARPSDQGDITELLLPLHRPDR